MARAADVARTGPDLGAGGGIAQQAAVVYPIVVGPRRIEAVDLQRGRERIAGLEPGLVLHAAL